MRFRLDTLAKRITLGFWCLSFLLAAGQCFLLINLWDRGTADLEQQLNNEVAAHIAAELRPLLSEGFDSRALQRALNRVESLNPRLDVMLLDTSGKVRLRANKELEEDQSPVSYDVATLESFLQLEFNREPIQIADPYFFGHLTPFVAERIEVAGESAYLLVLLNGRRFRVATDGARNMYIIIGAVITSLVFLLFMGTFGALLFAKITKRFSTMVQDVSRIAQGDFDAKVDVRGSDEVSRLGRAINTMSETIIGSLKQTEEASRERRELMAMVAHDLGGPLAAIRGNAELLLSEQQRQMTDDSQERLEAVLRNTQRLSAMTQELAELSKLERLAAKPHRDEFSVVDLVIEDILPRLRPLAEERGVQLHPPDDIELPTVEADIELVDRALKNLVENAIRYNNQNGNVWVTVEARDEAKLLIRVRDDGPGIAAEDLPNIFRRFYRGTSANASRLPGTGLGLAIVKRALEVQGADIRVESSLSGTEFCFELPIAE